MSVPILMVPSWQIVGIDVLSPKDTLIVCEEALRLWRTNAFEFLLVSGGLFLPPEIQTQPSSHLMARWFVEHGVAPTLIITESRSLDTYDNLRYSLAELASRGVDPDITVCTHRIHGIRIRHTFHAAFGQTVRIHEVHFPLSSAEWINQWLCVLYHYADRRGYGWLARRTRAKRQRQP